VAGPHDEARARLRRLLDKGTAFASRNDAQNLLESLASEAR
jgi:hypothetical protein